MSNKYKSNCVLLGLVLISLLVIIPIDAIKKLNSLLILIGHNSIDISVENFGTLKILQDNLRPFVVVFITLTTTIYLKIYGDLQQRQLKDVEKFQKDFFEAYDKLQKDIDKYEKGKEVEMECGGHIRTNLRNLMSYEFIIRKSGFFDFFENFELWRRTKKDYACDAILDNGKNLLQDCLDNIKNKYCFYIKFEHVFLGDIHFRNIVDTLLLKHVCFDGANFSNSKINFRLNEYYNEDEGLHLESSLCHAIFKKSEIFFSTESITVLKEPFQGVCLQFPEIIGENIECSTFKFVISDWRWIINKSELLDYAEKAFINFFKKLPKSTKPSTKKVKKNSFIFYFEVYKLSEHNKKYSEIIEKYNEIIKKCNKYIEEYNDSESGNKNKIIIIIKEQSY